MAERGRRKVRRLHGAVLVLFLLLALGLSYPLVARLTTHVPGSATWAFDEYTFVWNNWWFKEAVVDRLTSPLSTDLLFFPLGIDLILHTYNFFNALTALPLLMIMGPPAASNVTLILSTVLSGYGVFLLVRYLMATMGGAPWRSSSPADRSPSNAPLLDRRGINLASLLAGVVYAFAANRAVYAALGHYDMVTTQWLPFYSLYLIKTVRAAKTVSAGYPATRDRLRPVLRYGALAGLFFTLAVLAEMIFGVFLGIFTLLVLVLELWRPKIRLRAWVGRLALGLVAIGLVVAVLWSPVLAPIAREFASGEYTLEGWGEATKLSSDLLGLVTPTALHPLWGGDWVQEMRAVEEGTGRFADVNTVFVGYLTLALALLGFLAHRRYVRLWGWTALLFGLFCLGPLLQIAGRHRFDLDGLDVTFPMPYALLHYIPIVQANRAPNRNSVFLMLGLAVLAGYGAAFLLRLLLGRARRGPVRRRSVRWSTILVATIGVLVLFEHAAVPAPLTEASVPAVYEQIAAEPGAFSIMQLPLGWRTSFGPLGSERTQVQLYQTVHGKPIIGGNIARSPAFKIEYFERIPLFRALTDLELYREPDSETDALARDQAGELMQLYNTRYLIVLPPIPGRWPYQDTYARTWEYAREVLPLEPEPFYEKEGVRAYRIVQPEWRLPLEIDIGTTAALPYRGEGWHDDEVIFGETAAWAGTSSRRTNDAELFFPLRERQEVRLSLRIAPFAYAGAMPQTLRVSINASELGESWTLAEGWQVVQLTLPADSVVQGLNRLRLHFGRVERPRDVLPGQTAIGTTGVHTPVDIEVDAAADHAYISVYDEAGDRLDASAGRRGYNVAVLDQRSGRLLDKRGFDTWANEYEAQRLAEYVSQIPMARIVVVASFGEAARQLTSEAIAALRSLGAQMDLRGSSQAHAIVGVKGADPGSALELVGEPNAWLRLGLNPDRRALAAAVDWMKIEQ